MQNKEVESYFSLNSFFRLTVEHATSDSPAALGVTKTLVSSKPSFSRLGIAHTLRDLPSALGLTKTLDYIRPDINVFAFVAEKGFAITSGNLIEDLQESDENYDNNSFDSYF